MVPFGLKKSERVVSSSLCRVCILPALAELWAVWEIPSTRSVGTRARHSIGFTTGSDRIGCMQGRGERVCVCICVCEGENE
jgi:hypothetical protein